MSVAKSAGGVQTLFPDECNVQNIPADLMLAIDHAIRILSWQENMIDGEMPERWKWHLDHELVLHFDLLKKKKEEGRSSPSSSSSDEAVDEWEENAYASRFR